MNAKIVCLPGDGIGPEIVDSAVTVLERVAENGGHEFEFESALIGGAAIDAEGTALPDATAQACKRADAVLLGAVGGPKWDDPNAAVRPEQGLLKIRQELGLYANIRPLSLLPGLGDSSPLRPERLEGVDMVIVRELTGGIYFGRPRVRETVDGIERAVDTMVYTVPEVQRVVRRAFEIARGRRRRVCSVDKANVLESSRLWRSVAVEVAKEYPDVELEHQLVDSCAMRLVTAPASFDVIVTGNMFGDILSDEAAVLSGSLGTLPSASMGEGTRGLYEPIHGSAPDIAGTGAANPVATISSAAMLLRLSLGLETEAAQLESAVAAALAKGAKTRDLGGELTTEQMTAAIVAEL